MKAAVFSVKSNLSLEAEASGSSKNPENIGKSLAKKLLEMGAARFLKEARSTA